MATDGKFLLTIHETHWLGSMPLFQKAQKRLAVRAYAPNCLLLTSLLDKYRQRFCKGLWGTGLHLVSYVRISRYPGLGMRFDIFTLFPSMFEGPLQASILQRAQESGHLSTNIHNIRDYTEDKHHVTDDAPYGGGGGMVMKPEPIFAAVESVLDECSEAPLILLSPQGRLFTQSVAFELAQYPHIALVCGRYEGVDERVRQYLVTDEISIGDYVLTGGELAAMVVVDAVTRLLPGVLGDPGATLEDSHAEGLLEGPHYTRPAIYREWEVPPILLSGNHAAIARWRREQSLRRTAERRPDLLKDIELKPKDRAFLSMIEEVEAEN